MQHCLNFVLQLQVRLVWVKVSGSQPAWFGTYLTCIQVSVVPVQQVLHRFLQVYGSFDWDTMCLTLHGPVPLAKVSHQRGAPLTPLLPSATLSFSFHVLAVIVAAACALLRRLLQQIGLVKQCWLLSRHRIGSLTCQPSTS